MLVALSLMAVLATALYLSLHVGFRARTGAEAALAPVRSATLALELLRRDVETALPPTGVLAGTFFGEDAAGTVGVTEGADTLEFYSAAENTVEGAPGIYKFEFALVEGEEAGDGFLVRRLTQNLLAPETPEPVEEVLCRGVKSFNLRYFDGTDWLDSWDSTLRENALPYALEAELEISDADAARAEDGYTLVRTFLLPCGGIGASQRGSAGTQPST
jgi:hypothetical protein